MGVNGRASRKKVQAEWSILPSDGTTSGYNIDAEQSVLRLTTIQVGIAYKADHG